MSKAELGTKRVCGSCGAKFYDLLKAQIVCPKCATVFVVPEATPVKPRRAAQYMPPKNVVKAPVVEAESVVPAGAEEETEGAEGKIDDAVLIVADEHDEDEDVGNILGNASNKHEGS